MNRPTSRPRQNYPLPAALLALAVLSFNLLAQPAPQAREFPPGGFGSLDELPPSRLRNQLEQLPAAAQGRALQWLRSVHFTEGDLPSLHADPNGGILYACEVELAPDEEVLSDDPPAVGLAAVPVNPFPASLVFHSRPGAANVLYLNFEGENVTNTEWNTYLERSEIPALAFSSDSDYSSYSDSEQVAIKRIWQRIAEDYAPFNIDVTTERPAIFTTRTAVALITRNTDANGEANPFSTAGGVAYLNVFGTSSYAKYRPAWIYHNNFGSNESYTAEAASHEIGHNLGLSHDGKTDGSEYYGGHGSGDISWGPLMGTGYNRNVSQWCKGEYYLANNTQDDLATIAGKLSYRADDHGNTAGTATALVISGGTNIVATTPENDPTNTHAANKGVLERNTDLDVFSFITGSGPVQLSVNPWIMPSGTRGGNLDILLELHNEAGTLVQTTNSASQTTALLQSTLGEGRYYLHVRASGAGDPFSSSPTGYTVYGSIGQYFINGYVTEPVSVVMPPLAELQISDLAQPGQSTKEFTVNYSDDLALDVSTIDSADIRVTGPNGYGQTARLVAVSATTDGTPRTATYAADPPAGDFWAPADNGTYTVWMQSDQVGDTQSAWVAAGQLGQFTVAVPSAIYFASMDADPGWTLEPQWEFGAPAFGGTGPTGGFTGTRIIGYNLSGNYADRLAAKYATTTPINTTGSSSLTLRFQRWLRLMSSDTATIQASTNGTSWVDVWSASGTVSDNGWREVQYPLPAGIAGSATVQIRWSMASNPARSDIGWNLDDVELLGDGALDSTPPVPALSVADLTLGGSPSHSCSVTYNDSTAVRLSSLDANDLLVTGPNGYSNLVEFIGADLPSDGSPMTGTYSISAPGGTWDAADNGTYTVTLLEGAVEDTLNNSIPQTTLGGFNVSISAATAGALEVTPIDNFSSSGTVGGPFSPSSIIYTLGNSGASSLNWTASKTQSWVSLSATSGTLTAGASTTLTVSVNPYADSLASGSYSDTVSFVNVTRGEGNTTRAVTLTVNAPGRLEVSPAEGLDSSGYVGSLFSPSSITYTLANTGGTTIGWSASKTADWLDLSAASGTMDPGTSTTLTVSLNAQAGSLAIGSYSDDIALTAGMTKSAAYLLPVTLEVAPPLRFTLYRFAEPGVFQMGIEAIAGTEIVLEASANLKDWTHVSTNQVAADGTVTFSDPAGAQPPNRWYRARVAP
ncbi:MAG: hypothetical protein KJ072_03030 [Verrucomicrobia bacterium]|nr:hypothetical protein [Verrucomicrobiota bacterium]